MTLDPQRSNPAPIQLNYAPPASRPLLPPIMFAWTSGVLIALASLGMLLLGLSGTLSSPDPYERAFCMGCALFGVMLLGLDFASVVRRSRAAASVLSCILLLLILPMAWLTNSSVEAGAALFYVTMTAVAHGIWTMTLFD